MPDTPISIALHIGAHKTASSHLQNTLYRNRKMLSEEGIRVYGPGFLRKEGRSLAALFGLSWHDGPAPDYTPQEQLDLLAEGFNRLVFTEENFTGIVPEIDGRVPLPLYPEGPARIAELVEKWTPAKPQIFLAIRNPTSFLASAYSQTLFKTQGIGPRSFRARNDWRKVNWADYIARLRAIPGIGKIHVWRHEDYEATQTLILRRLLRWRVGIKIDVTDSKVNVGLSSEAVRQTLIWGQDGRQGDLAREARHMFPVGGKYKKFELYLPPTKQKSAAFYEEQLAQIAAMKGVTLLRRKASTAKG